jgi:tetratricopeptide (TPR) repeat protein
VLAARQLRPTLVGPTYLLALVRVSRGDMQQGAELLSAVARAVPSHAVARFQLGQILYAQGDPARAGTLYEMAWELEPTFVSPPLALCEMLVESRQYGEALSILERVCQAAPTSLPPRQMQLRILLELGERDSRPRARPSPARAGAGRPRHDPALRRRPHRRRAPRRRHRRSSTSCCRRPASTPPRRCGRVASRRGWPSCHAASTRPSRCCGARPATPRRPSLGEVCLELVHVGLAQQRPEDADLGLSLLTKSSDVSSLVSGALLARQHQLTARARALAEKAKSLVPGTPAAAQLEGFIAALG